MSGFFIPSSLDFVLIGFQVFCSVLNLHPPKQYRNREESVSKQDRKRTNPNLVLLPRYTFAPSFKAKP